MDQPTRKQDLPSHLRSYATLFETTSMRKWLLHFTARGAALVLLGRMTPEQEVGRFKDAWNERPPKSRRSGRELTFTDADAATLFAYLKGTIPNLERLVDHEVSTIQGPATFEYKYTDPTETQEHPSPGQGNDAATGGQGDDDG